MLRLDENDSAHYDQDQKEAYSNNEEESPD